MSECYAECHRGCSAAKGESTMREFLEATCGSVCTARLARHPETLDMTACLRDCKGEHVVEAEERVAEVCGHACGALKAGKLPDGSPCRPADSRDCAYDGEVRVTPPCATECRARPDGTHRCGSAPRGTAAPRVTAAPSATAAPALPTSFWPSKGLLSTVESAAPYHVAGTRLGCAKKCACASELPEARRGAVERFRSANHPLAGLATVYVHADGSVGRDSFTERHRAVWRRTGLSTPAPSDSAAAAPPAGIRGVARTAGGRFELEGSWELTLRDWRLDCFANDGREAVVLCGRPCPGKCEACSQI